jgi:hypothetical protein
MLTLSATRAALLSSSLAYGGAQAQLIAVAAVHLATNNATNGADEKAHKAARGDVAAIMKASGISYAQKVATMGAAYFAQWSNVIGAASADMDGDADGDAVARAVAAVLPYVEEKRNAAGGFTAMYYRATGKATPKEDAAR